MIRMISSLRNPFISMTLVAGSVLATGCVDSAEPTTSAVEHALVNRPGLSPVAPLQEVQISGDRVSITSAGWTQAAPGIWSGKSAGGAGTVIVGAEGHRQAIAQAEHDLEALRASGGSVDQVQQHEAYLAHLQSAADLIATQAIVPRALSCNIGFVIGPSSGIIPGFVGEFAGVQLVCTGGTQVFTVQAQACTNFGCGPVSTFTPTIGATAQLFGTATAGTAGAGCFGQANVTPPGVTGSATNPCG
jgi:hypothetical protein